MAPTPDPPASPAPPAAALEQDHVLAALRAAVPDGTPPPPQGRVLAVKLGYNPNSSSVGSVVSVLFWSATAAAAALNLTAALLAKHRAGPPDAPPADAPPPDAP